MRDGIRKGIIIIIYLSYYNICLFFLVGGVYSDLITLAIIVLDQFTYLADTAIRPRTPRETMDFTTKLIALFFLFHPFFIVILYYEHLLLTSVYLQYLDIVSISYLGIVISVIGSIISIGSRIQLGRYGDGTTALKEGHELLTQGIYGYIRHPLYAGALTAKIGIGLVFRSYLSMMLYAVVLFTIVRTRMSIEEASLTEEFGEVYESYMEQTKRLFPYLY